MHSLKPSLAIKRPRPPSPPPLSTVSTPTKLIPPPLPKPLPPETPPISSKKPTPHFEWVPLNLSQSELSLPLTFPTGQTFRWKQTGPLQYTGTIGPHLLSLKHLQNGDVSYFIHSTPSESGARLALLDFLNMGISLAQLWHVFSENDSRFAELAKYLKGARVLRQDPVECLVQFLCSSNNNIGRITKMVDFVSSLGTYLGSVGEFEFHEFPSLERVSAVSEAELRQAGFGYRLLQRPKYLLPELTGARLTPKLCSRVAEAFVSKYGEYAGWAQTLLFIAELPSQKALLPSHLWDNKEKKSTTLKERR